MSNRGFSGTSIAIVVLLVVALFAIGHIPGVNAPPEQPEKPAASAQNAAQPISNKERMAQMVSERKKMMAERGTMPGAGLKKSAAALKPVQDPNSIVATNKFFMQEPDGQQGIAKTQEDLAKQKAEYDRYRKALQQNKPKASVNPMSNPALAAP